MWEDPKVEHNFFLLNGHVSMVEIKDLVGGGFKVIEGFIVDYDVTMPKICQT